MIEIRQLQKNYQDFHLDCSLRVEDGMITGLAGKNGAGKSTTFKAILGLIRADGGEVEVFGKKAADLRMEDREQMGVVLSDSGISEYLAVEDLIPVMKNLYTKFDEKSFRERCERFDLPYHKKIKEFSTGMKRKLQINLALSHEAKLLILDEPTAGLDPGAHKEILNMIRKVHSSQENIIIFVSHNMADVADLSDKVIVMDEGKLVMSGTPQDVFCQQERLAEIGLSVPPVTDFMHRLRKGGLNIDDSILTVKEAEAVLYEYLQRKQ